NIYSHFSSRFSVLLQLGMTGEGFSMTPEEIDKEHFSIFNVFQFQFGDIISFKPKCWAGFRVMHFAVYVGDVDICGKKQTEVIYEQSKKIFRCKFSKLHLNLEPEVNNYLDDYTDPSSGRTYCKGDDKSIIDRITETYEDSGMYGLFHYNCEHLATYVRYGVKVAVQFKRVRMSMSILTFQASKHH
uniref:LRAT domain-containing protein n=1 Tax=Oryzias latipes TaxID=8090 RepID=A0A3B3HRF7_ORYLA